MGLIVLDTETTGLDIKQGHKIIEIAAIELKQGGEIANKFHYYLNPQRDIDNRAYKIHGISLSFLSDKPLFKDIADEFLEFVGSKTLVIHNARFDTKFINYELGLINKPSLNLNKVIDTLEIAREKFPREKVNLDALCKRFNIDNSNRQLHGALKDTQLLAQVYLAMVGYNQGSFKFSSNNDATSKTSINKDFKFVIIKPTQDELEAHKGLIKKIKNNY